MPCPCMTLRFNEVKTTQAAARLLFGNGGHMEVLKLVKLLYLADRKALLRWGRPVTFDRYFSLPHGPVLGVTLDRINEPVAPEGPSYWQTIISEREGHAVRLLGPEPPRDDLSPAEEALLDELYEEFGRMDTWALHDYSHTLPRVAGSRRIEDPDPRSRYPDGRGILPGRRFGSRTGAGGRVAVCATLRRVTLLGAGRAILYPFIRHPTVVQYSTAERFRVKRLIKAIQRGQCHLKEDMSEELLDKGPRRPAALPVYCEQDSAPLRGTFREVARQPG